MKLNKLFAGFLATAVAATALSAAASANEAFLMYTDDSWAWGVWDAASCPGTVDVNGDGTYTVYIDSSIDAAKVEDEDTGELVPAVANGAMVFCVDIEDLAADLGIGKGADGYEDLKTEAEKMAFAKDKGVELTALSITTYSADGTETDIPVDLAKLYYGDIEGNGKLRIEIQNEYGDTAKDPAIDKSLISFDDKIAVTFTLAGIDGAGAADADVAIDAATGLTPDDVNDNGYFRIVSGADTGEAALFNTTTDDVLNVYGVRYYVTFDQGEVDDEATWIGGGVGANSESTGWEMHEWGKASGEKEITPDFSTGIIEWMDTEPVFAATDTYAHLWLQTWGGTVTIDKIEVLDANKNVIWATGGAAAATVEEAPVEVTTTETAATGDVSAATDSGKGSPDTGIADVAAVAGLAVVAAGAVVVAKKRK